MDTWALFNQEGLLFLLRWVHFLAGIAWIGILWFFNFMQGPFMNEVDGSVKTAVNQKLAPRTLWYFRWGAMLTFLSGWAIIGIQTSRPGGAELLVQPWGITILAGALMGSIMWYNVWFVIWPRQKKVIAAANGAAVENLPALARRAFLASRTNTLLSIPLLFMMGAARHLTMGVESSVGAWYAALIAILALVEINALVATKGPTTAPIEKPSGVIHMGIWLTVLLYVLRETLL